ncbi:hypothetical protein FKM82_023660 [Ascaphus truei]
MAGVAVSRVFILAHFPHQVLTGILCGVCLGHVLQKRVPQDHGFRFFATASFLLLFGATILYWGMSAVGVDLSWSIHLANKWCSRPEWLRPETRPFSSVTRSTGSALGLGIALHCRRRGHTPGWKERGARVLLSLLLLRLLVLVPLPASSPLLSYALNFLRHSLCPLAVIVLVPCITQVLSKETTPKRD